MLFAAPETASVLAERHLAGLVHEQHVHRPRELLPRPQPRGAAEDVCLPGLQDLEGFAVVAHGPDAGRVVGVVAVPLVSEPHDRCLWPAAPPAPTPAGSG